MGTTNPGGQESAKSVDPLTVLMAFCVNLLIFHYLRSALCKKILSVAIIFALRRQGYYSDLNNKIGIAMIVTLVTCLVSLFRIKFLFSINFCTQVFYIYIKDGRVAMSAKACQLMWNEYYYQTIKIKILIDCDGV